MPTRIAVAHDELAFSEQVVAALRLAGHDPVVFTDPLRVLDAIDDGEEFDLLVTRVNFGPGKPHGVALARMVKWKRPGIPQVVFTARANYAEDVEGLGELVPHPVNLSALLAAVDRALKPEWDVEEQPRRKAAARPSAGSIR